MNTTVQLLNSGQTLSVTDGQTVRRTDIRHYDANSHDRLTNSYVSTEMSDSSWVYEEQQQKE